MTKPIVNVAHTAKLAKLTLTPSEEVTLSAELESTLKTIKVLEELDVSKISTTSQVTGLTNIFRDDVVDSSRQFTQEQALSGAKQTHNGFIVVPQLINS